MLEKMYSFHNVQAQLQSSQILLQYVNTEDHRMVEVGRDFCRLSTPTFLHKAVFFCKATFQSVGWQRVQVRGVIPPQMQDLVFPFVKRDDIALVPFLQPVEAPLNGGITISCVDHSSRFSVICRLAWSWTLSCYSQPYDASNLASSQSTFI